MTSVFDVIVKNCEQFGAAVRKKGGFSPAIEVGPPATEEEVLEVESALGRRITASLRSVFVNHARSFSFEWSMSDFANLPEPLDQHSEGRCFWSLELLPLLDADLREWRESMYDDPSDEYSSHWHGVLAVCATGLSNGASASDDYSGGDFFAIRENAPAGAPVVFLSHDGAECNGLQLADSFEDFLFRWSTVGCTGGESGWALEDLVPDESKGIAPDGDFARAFRKRLGVKLISRI